MSTELIVLAWGCVLAIVHISAAAQAKSSRYGFKWVLSPRDAPMPEVSAVGGRLARAQANFFETFPVVIAAALMLTVAGRSTELSAIGAWMWLGGRVAYLPFYAIGIPLRSLAFAVSLIGVVMMLWPLFG